MENIIELGQVPLKSKNIANHNWIYSRSDLYKLHLDQSFNLLAEIGGARGIAFALRTHLENGLYQDEVDGQEFADRISQYGTNQLPEPEMSSFFEHCKEALEDELLIVLAVAGLISFVLGFIEDPSHGWYEGVAIWAAVVIVTLVGAGNNYQQERKFDELNQKQEKPTSRVIRKGEEVQILASELHVGDIVAIMPGDAINADGLMVADISTKPIKVDESSMTGEPLAIEKNFYQPFMKAGTAVTTGSCHMLVTAVGLDTTIGQIMMDTKKKSGPTKLQEKLALAAKYIGFLGMGTGILMFVALCIFWAVDVIQNDKVFMDHAADILEYFIIGVTIVVVAVPEGLPLAVNISLAFSMKKMLKDQILVKILTACETMGNCTTICSDKTGTLTQNVMTVEECNIAGEPYIALDSHRAPELKNQQTFNMQNCDKGFRTTLIHSIVLNSTIAYNPEDPANKEALANGVAPEHWHWESNGNASELALNAWFIRNGVDIFAERDAVKLKDKEDFNSTLKYSSIVIQQKDGTYRRYFKGAAERIINISSHVVDSKGNRGVDCDQKQLHSYVEQKAGQAYRNLAFCFTEFKEMPVDPVTQQTQLRPFLSIEDAVFIGVSCLKDPLRPESRHSVRTCQRAGIIVRMVTGDHIKTATKIAEDCGIITNKDHISILGDDFEYLHDKKPAELAKKMPFIRVIARSKPHHKKKLVMFLKSEQGGNNQVAVTGDGTNDAQAMAVANIGIAMNSGTDVAKNAAHTVIIDDRFSSIVRSVMWGRSVYDNIAKFVQFQLTVNLVALTISLVGAFTGFTSPLKAVQLLWVNLIMDTMAALALGTEAPTHLLLRRYPFEPEANLISPAMSRNILAQTFLQLALLCIILYAPQAIFNDDAAHGGGFTTEDEDHGTVPSDRHYTLIFNAFVFLQFFNEINCRKVNDELNVFKAFFANLYFTGVLVVTLICQFILVQFVGDFAETVAISWEDWGICIALGVTSLPVGWLTRVIFNGRFGLVDFNSGRVSFEDLPYDPFAGATLDQMEDHEEDFLDIDKVDPNAAANALGE